MVEYLLQNGAEIGKKERRGWTAAHYAAYLNRFRSARVLLTRYEQWKQKEKRKQVIKQTNKQTNKQDIKEEANWINVGDLSQWKTELLIRAAGFL